MAGSTTAPFRRLCQMHGASYTVTELVSARSIAYDPSFAKTARYLAPAEGEDPYVIQLFGFDPDDFDRAIAALLEHPTYRRAAWIDLNYGCPVPKVVRTGAGSALMRTTDRAVDIAKTAVRRAATYGRMITVKMRSGWDESHKNAPDLAAALEQVGVAAITLHARTRDQFYAGRADRTMFRRVRDRIRIPLFANGDIASADDLRTIGASAEVDGYAIGRAARGNPFIFDAVRRDLNGVPDAYRVPTDQWLETVILHLDGMIDLVGEAVACREMRTEFAAYVRDFPGSAAHRAALMRAENRNEAVARLERAAEDRRQHEQSSRG